MYIFISISQFIYSRRSRSFYHYQGMDYLAKIVIPHAFLNTHAFPNTHAKAQKELDTIRENLIAGS